MGVSQSSSQIVAEFNNSFTRDSLLLAPPFHFPFSFAFDSPVLGPKPQALNPKPQAANPNP